MKAYVILLYFVSCFAVRLHQVHAFHKLVVVSPMAHAEFDFIRMKTSPKHFNDTKRGGLHELEFSNNFSGTQDLEYPGEPHLTSEYDLRVKNRICTHIFNTALFDMRRENVVDLTQPNVRGKLSRNHAVIYEDMFGNLALFLNPYKEREIFIKNYLIHESMFRCLTRTKRERTLNRDETDSGYELGKLHEYFLTSIYNLNELGTSDAIVQGRFIFTRGENGLSLFAMVEESAVVDTNNVFESTHRPYFYAGKDADFQEPDDPSTNSICEMNSAQKIRLCNLIFNSTEYRDQMIFWPSEDYIEPECQLETVSATTLVNAKGIKGLFYRRNLFEEVNIWYKEYMFGCKTVSANPGELFLPSFYVSRGYAAHTAIVYKRSEENVYTPELGFSKVSVIAERGQIRSISLEPIIDERRPMW